VGAMEVEVLVVALLVEVDESAEHVAAESIASGTKQARTVAQRRRGPCLVDRWMRQDDTGSAFGGELVELIAGAKPGSW
jgi:hypothetical protein